MTGGIETIDRFCVYGVVTDYDALHEVLRDRVRELQTTHEQIDAVSGLQSGYASKILAPVPIKGLGKTSLGPMLQTLGLALVVVRDDEQFARIKERLAKRQRPLKQQANAGSVRPTWLFSKKTAREMGKKRFSVMTEAQRKRLARKAGKASGRARRRRRITADRSVNT